MSNPHRVWALRSAGLLTILAIGLTSVAVSQAPAQPKPDPGKPEESAPGLTLPTDPRVKRMLEAIEELLRDEDWDRAIEPLQRLLTLESDVFVAVKRKSPDGKEVQLWVSARASADRRIANLPPKGKELYLQRYGPKAAELLKEAKDRKDPELLAQVARHYRHTDSGAEALKLLQKELDKLAPVGPAAQADWPLFQGNASRSAQGIGSAPFLEKKWTQPTIRQTETRRLVMDQAVKVRQDRGEAVLPAFFPIVTDGKLIYRSYWGIHAVDPKKDGKLTWEAHSDWSLDRMLGNNRKSGAIIQWIQMYFNRGRHQALFENSTVGTLSTDGQQVYSVEDLALPPADPFLDNPWGAQRNLPYSADLNQAINLSRLRAFAIRTGKLEWEVGGPAFKKDGVEVKEGNELHDCYFLGPPLPLGGKLYVLTEKNQELRLTCLVAEKGTLQWLLPLVNPADKLIQDPGRRMQAASLAFGQGILVCPTNAGAIVGVDLLTRSVAWVHIYREKRAFLTPEEEQLIRQGVVPRRPGFPPAAANSNELKISAPIIQDGKVVFTAPDGAAIHCLNLRDGSLVWKANRAEKDLYLAGVFAGRVLIVGKESARALDLATGQFVWQLPTGLPSGRGIASENIYYLPLKSAAATKEPEVCAIDVVKGIVIAHTKLRKKEVPGNLLFHDGDVISQSVNEICAYPQLRARLKEIDQRLGANPKDPVGLTERAELLFDKGDLPGAVEDLRTALVNNPPKELLPRLRSKLYEALTELLQRDFKAAEKYLDEYRGLLKIEIDPAATAEERKTLEAKRHRRQSNYLFLLACGREGQGRLADAFEAYLEFATQAADQELISVADDPAVKTRPDVWAKGRIAALLAKATAEQRKPLEEKIAANWRDIRKADDPAAMSDFVGMFAPALRVGREAQLHLAERLIVGAGRGGALEAERMLLVLRQQKDDPELAGRAVETLARLNARHGTIEDAVHYYRILARDFARTAIRDGKTGADLFGEIATDKRFLPYLNGQGLLQPAGKIKVEEQREIKQQSQQNFAFQPEGELLPFLQKHRVVLSLNDHRFKLLDRASGEEKWAQRLTQTNFQNYIYAGPPNNNPRFSYHMVGHVIVLPLGPMVFGIDPVGRQLLWEKSLFGSQGVPPQANIIPNPVDGSLSIVYQDGWVHRVGQIGPVQPSYLCLQTREGLTALDPVTGKTLWTRGDVSSRSDILGDERHILLVDLNADGTASSTRALRAADGVEVKVPDFSGLYRHLVRPLGCNLLLSETDDKGALTLRLYDALAGKDEWKKAFPAGSVLLRSEEPELTGAIRPNGEIIVLDVASGKELLKAAIDPKHVGKPQAVHLLRDSLNWYVMVNGPIDKGIAPWGGPWPNVIPDSGIRSVPVNGEVYALRRDNGEVSWHTPVPMQMLLFEQFQELPILLFTARYQKLGSTTAVKSIDKRNGKLVYDQPEIANGTHFYEFRFDPGAGRIDLLGYNLNVTHILTGAGEKSKP